MFSKNTTPVASEVVVNILGVMKAEMHEKYLMLLALLGNSKKDVFANIRERIWKKVKRRKEKLLSKAMNKVLIKVVAQACPTYAMSCFKLPACVCDDIKFLHFNFWRNSNFKFKRFEMSKLGYDVCCKKEGGLGFRDLQAFNLALLAKKGWSIINNPDSLLARVLKAKYFPNSSFWATSRPGWASIIWKSICDA